MTKTNALEKPKAYETVPLSRLQSASDSLDYLGDKLNDYLGGIGIKMSNRMYGLEQKSPNTANAFRYIGVPAVYLLAYVGRAAAAGFLDHFDPALFSGLDFSKPDQLIVVFDTQNSTILGMAPVGCEGSHFLVTSPGYHPLEVSITPESHTFGAVQTAVKMGNDTIYTFSPVEVHDSNAVIEASNNLSGSLDYFKHLTGIVGSNNTITVEVTPKGIEDFNPSDDSKLYDVALRAKANGTIYSYDGHPDSGLKGDILTGNLVPKLQDKVNGVRNAFSDLASYLSA